MTTRRRHTLLCPRGSCNAVIGHFDDDRDFMPVGSEMIADVGPRQANGMAKYTLRCSSCGKEWEWTAKAPPEVQI